MSEKQYRWDEDDVLTHHTKKVKKIWDNVLPETYPHVLGFDTEGVTWVEHRRQMGPYTMNEDKLKYKVRVNLASEPLENIGWTSDVKITNEIFKKAYGEDFDYELRNSMRALLAYVGLGNVGHFDFIGDITYYL